MGLTRKYLSAMGLGEEQVEEIIKTHVETVNAIKDERDTYKGKVGELDAVKKELADAKAALENKEPNDFEEKYLTEKKAFEDFKKDIEAKKARTAKETAVKTYLNEKGIDDKVMKLAMKYVDGLIDDIELGDEGIKDFATLDAALDSDLKPLIASTETQGANTETPPDNNLSSGTGAQIPKIF